MLVFLQLLPLVFILWPFNIGWFSSQILGLVLFFVLVLPFFNFYSLLKIRLPTFSIFWFCLYFIVLIISCLFSVYDSEVYKLLYYSVMMPFLFFVSFVYYDVLGKNTNFHFHKIFYTATPFIVFCLLEIIFPSFHRYINPYVMTDAAQIVLENNASGNVFRFLGWNGFLFSDYSVALAFTALGVLIFNVKTTIFSLFIEFSSIMLALIAGRSGLPIVFVYFLIAVFIKPSFFRLMLIFLLLSLGTVLILRLKGIDFFIWLFEPIYRLIEEGSFSSNSVAETGGQFSDFLSSVSFQDDGVFFGNGIYFSSNDSYFEFNFVSGDSAIIRLYHSIGIFGTAFFLMIWLSMLIKLFFSTVLNHTSYKIYAVFFVFYGIVFFLKSEWLYQKFYIFILFFLYHSIYSRYEKNYRRVSEE